MHSLLVNGCLDAPQFAGSVGAVAVELGWWLAWPMTGNWRGLVTIGMTLMAIVCTGSVRAQVEVAAGPVVNPANEHEYFLLSVGGWHESEVLAIALGGHLVTIDDASEQAWVFDTFGAWGGIRRSLWIGLNDSAKEGEFVWADGSLTGYSNWLPGQPDNSPVTDGEDYVHMLNTGNEYGHPGGFWNDLTSPNSVFTTFDPVCGVVELPHPVRPTLQWVGNPPMLCWRARPGTRCRVEYRARLDAGGWLEWTGMTTDASGRSCVEMTGVVGQGEGFFRVVVVE